MSATSALDGVVARAESGTPLTSAEMRLMMEAILAGKASDGQMSAFLLALRARGETSEEIGAAAAVLRERCATLNLREGLADGAPLMDTCGTGGDGAGTFNLSTMAAIVVASAGVRVAKHGNRAVSSRAGSADVLEALGVRLDVTPEALVRSVREAGIGFMFAPRHHEALRHAAPVRKALGVRTLFNLLGPLANPAGASHQLLGVYDDRFVRPLAEVLQRLGTKRAWVVHGEGGVDEVSPYGATRVVALADGALAERTVSPADFGLAAEAPGALVGGDAQENARIARRVLAGERSPYRTGVVLNAAAALFVAEAAPSLGEARAMAEASLDSGRARTTLDRWVEITQE